MSYQIDVSPDVQKVIPTLPGNIRQRIRRAISSLAQDPRPSRSKKLEFSLVDGEPRRLRLEKWRILYVIIETDIKLVAILAVRKRPPYSYGDLSDLFAEFTE